MWLHVAHPFLARGSLNSPVVRVSLLVAPRDSLSRRFPNFEVQTRLELLHLPLEWTLPSSRNVPVTPRSASCHRFHSVFN